MTKYNYLASYDVRKVLWEEIQAEGLLDISDYYADGFDEPMVPIIPAQQVPEFNNLLPGRTYIIYDISQRNTNVQWWMNEETIVFDVVSRNSSEIQTIINLVIDFFRRYDQSARDFNMALVDGSPYRYHFFRLDYADPVQAFAHEGGFMNGIVSISYSYTREVDYETGRYL